MSGAVVIESLMLIDDEEFDHELYRRMIDRSGLVGTTHHFSMVDDALDFLRSGGRPDVVLLDIRMPGLDGFDFLEMASEEFGDRFTDAVVVMLTTSLDPRDRERAEAHPVVKLFLNKPLTVDDLGTIADLVD